MGTPNANATRPPPEEGNRSAVISRDEIVQVLEQLWKARPEGLHELALAVSEELPSHYRIDVATKRAVKVTKHVFFDADKVNVAHVETIARIGHALLEDMLADRPDDSKHALVDRNGIARSSEHWRVLFKRAAE